MHNNYYLIRQLVPVLNENIVGSALVDCFSQNKDELILKFLNTASGQFIITAHLNPSFTCLSFPKEYHKARKNTASIFQLLMQQKVLQIEGYANERAFTIHFDNNYSLLFKLFGQQSNVLLLEKKKVKDLFRNNLQNDKNINPEELDRPIEQTKEAIINALPNLRTVYPTLDRRIRNLLEEKITNLDADEAYEQIRPFIRQLENPSTYNIIKDEQGLRFSLLPSTKSVATFTSPIEGLTQFFKLYLKKNNYQSTKNSLLKEFEQKATKTKAYIKKTKNKKDELVHNTSYKEMADLIMANLHLIEQNTHTVELLNFYTDKKITVKLNPKLSPQLNAEKYYNKSKNIAIEIRKLEEAILTKKRLLEELEQEIVKISNSSGMSDLQEFSKKRKEKETTKSTPFKQFNIDGFTVLVGNNAKQNDLLTLKFAKKNDLFFHAKDVSGSHVILKFISGQAIPAATLEKTAALAAYYSKRKTDSLCPVGYTPKKYVRKPKGSPPGLVLVEREKVLLVRPELPQ